MCFLCLVEIEEKMQSQGASEANDDERVIIRVINQLGYELHYRVRRWTKMSKLMTHFAGRMNTPVYYLRFIYKGELLLGGDTPDSLEMEPRDEIIEVYSMCPVK